MQFNTVNVYVKESVSWLALPSITEVVSPKTTFQKIAYWIGRKAGIFQAYLPKERVVGKKTIRLDGDDYAAISKTVLKFMESYGVDPQRDLIVLWDHK